MEEQALVQNIIKTLSVVNSPEIQDKLVFFKFVLGSVGLFFLFFVIFVLYRSSFLRYALFTDVREMATYRAFGLRRMTERWEKAFARLQSANEAEYKLGIIDVDSMLDESLKRLGFGGANLEDRLRIIPEAVLPNVRQVEQAHAVRNNIVHDPNFILSLNQARTVMAVYEKAFKDLDLI